MADTEIHLSLEDDLHIRTQRIAAELGIDEARLIETAVLSRFGEEELETPELGKKTQIKSC